MDCRTERMGTILCNCTSCGYSFEIYKSCGNRHCPTCQGEKANDWLSKRLDRMLPVHHFMITFTIPASFREFFRSHQSFAYSNLFNSSSFVLKKLASEKTYFDGDIPGFFGVLHTLRKADSIPSPYPLHRSWRCFLFFRLQLSFLKQKLLFFL